MHVHIRWPASKFTFIQVLNIELKGFCNLNKDIEYIGAYL